VKLYKIHAASPRGADARNNQLLFALGTTRKERVWSIWMKNSRKLLTTTLAATLLIGAVSVATPASAWSRWGGGGWGRHWGYGGGFGWNRGVGWNRPGWGYGRWGYGGFGLGAGLATGLALGAAASYPGYYGYSSPTYYGYGGYPGCW